MGIFDKAKDAVSNNSGNSDNSGKFDGAIDKAGDTVDEKTGDKYADQVDQGQEFLNNKLPGQGN